MIRAAMVQDIPQIKDIWEKAFDDSLDYVDFLYDSVTSPAKTLVVEEHGEIISMAMSLDCEFVFRDQSLKCVYIFGCATRPGQEWETLQMRLISRLEQNAQEAGAQMSVIIPGNRMLYSFYKKHGYTSEFPIRELKLRPGTLNVVPELDSPIALNTATNESVSEIREQALFEIPHIRWNDDQMDFLMMDAISYGELVASYEGEHGRSYAFYTPKNKVMYVRECLGTSEESVKVLLAGLIDLCGPRRVILKMPIDGGLLPLEGKKRNYGLAKLFQGGKTLSDFAPYMNLMLE